MEAFASESEWINIETAENKWLKKATQLKNQLKDISSWSQKEEYDCWRVSWKILKSIALFLLDLIDVRH